MTVVVIRQGSLVCLLIFFLVSGCSDNRRMETIDQIRNKCLQRQESFWRTGSPVVREDVVAHIFERVDVRSLGAVSRGYSSDSIEDGGVRHQFVLDGGYFSVLQYESNYFIEFSCQWGGKALFAEEFAIGMKEEEVRRLLGLPFVGEGGVKITEEARSANVGLKIENGAIAEIFLQTSYVD